MWDCLSFCLTRNSIAPSDLRDFFLSSTFKYLHSLLSSACQEGMKQYLVPGHCVVTQKRLWHTSSTDKSGSYTSLVLLCRAVCLTLPTKPQPAVCPRGCLPARNHQLSSLTTFQTLFLNPGKGKKLEDKEVRNLFHCFILWLLFLLPQLHLLLKEKKVWGHHTTFKAHELFPLFPAPFPAYFDSSSCLPQNVFYTHPLLLGAASGIFRVFIHRSNWYPVKSHTDA